MELDTLADSAIKLAVLRIIAARSPAEAPAAGGVLHWQLFDAAADVSIEREQGRIDLNMADDNLIYALFAANGWKPEDAKALAARIADWKDVDDETREGGAERGAYEKAGLAYTPRNGPFESPEELRQVLGTRDVPATLFQSLTVYTHSLAPLVSLAPAPVRRALQYANDQQLGGHLWLPVGEASATSVVSGMQDDAHKLLGEVVRIRACAKKRSAERCRLAVVRLTGSGQRPLQVFAWRGDSPTQ